MPDWETAPLFCNLEDANAEILRLRAKVRPFNDALADKVIDAQVKTIDRLNRELADCRRLTTRMT